MMNSGLKILDILAKFLVLQFQLFDSQFPVILIALAEAFSAWLLIFIIL